MGVKQLRYRGMTIKAGAFEVVKTGRFIVSLSIARVGMGARRKTKLFEPPSGDRLFR